MTTKDGLFLGVDLGGTNIEAAAVQYGEILASKKTQTQAHKGAIIVIERIEKAVREVMTKMDRPQSDFKALCIGAPGAVNLETGMVNDAPNLDWTDVPLGKELSSAFHCLFLLTTMSMLVWLVNMPTAPDRVRAVWSVFLSVQGSAGE